ncbi:putative serine/threonine-protein kinase Cx32, chloroplastic [Gossypium australe]|uniref:non-specific serine/threonine protein kinase n=1 Tax=Gossypium australe TaxID=47621 RepID=A0A5B6X4J9_9ROSI|nr:putative serine/threonine-protein kinase Cx32, chloroplastic [Gossypium australe]
MGNCWGSSADNPTTTSTTGHLSSGIGVGVVQELNPELVSAEDLNTNPLPLHQWFSQPKKIQLMCFVVTTSNTASYSTSRGSNISRGSGFSASSGDEAVPNGQILPAPNLRIFSFAELKTATKNFRPDMVLGEGGFGKVFKGWIDEKALGKSGTATLVAVKKLNSESLQGFEEWQSEVNFLGRLSHPHLVRLLGYCWEDKELLLVYEFMQKGSLENHLFGRGSSVQSLEWNIRIKIAIGAAKGLSFLHSSDKKVIYRDFKASNILLDGLLVTLQSYTPKLSDFGLAKLGPSASQSHVTTRVMGTYGYAAPEYVATGHLYVKSDVYGFGVVLVEIVTGLRALDPNRPSGQHNLSEWIKPYLSDRRKLKSIMDNRLEGKYPSKAAVRIAQLALKCLEPEPKYRPSMKEVVETLEQIESINDNPKEPRNRTARQTTRRHRQQPLHHRSPLAPKNETGRAN